MNGVWTSLDQKNDFIRRSNVSSCNINTIVDGISEITKNKNLPNIEEIRVNKVYQLDEEFKKQGMEIFEPHGSIAECIQMDLFHFTEEGTKELKKITDALSLTYPGFMTSSKIFKDKLYSILIKKYNELCTGVQNYTIKDNLRRIIFEFHRDNRYWIFVPGEYIGAWEKQKKELRQLGYEDFISENEVGILKLIKMQEEKSKAFELKEKSGSKQKLTDEEFGIELERLSKEREELKIKFDYEEGKMTR